MKKKFIAFSLCIILTNLCLAQNKEQKQIAPNSLKIPASKIEKIETAIAAWMAQHKAPALSIAIVTDNQMSFSKGYGVADVENNVRHEATRHIVWFQSPNQ
jgi:CubicO group peptidase (beta-lactamase class C family)